MAIIVHRKRQSLESPVKLSPGGDLWRYAPVKDANNRSLCDLMMLLPGIKREPELQVLIQHQLQEILTDFGDRVLFSDLNLRLGILWVTVTPEPGLCGEIADGIVTFFSDSAEGIDTEA